MRGIDELLLGEGVGWPAAAPRACKSEGAQKPAPLGAHTPASLDAAPWLR